MAINGNDILMSQSIHRIDLCFDSESIQHRHRCLYEHAFLRKWAIIALLTILPFVNCSAKMRDLICAKYTDSQSINICNALVFALSLESPNIVSLACKTWIMSALTHIIETQHSRQISSKIKDAYHGLVKYCIQILQCQNLLCHLRVCDLFKLKQYAIRYVRI